MPIAVTYPGVYIEELDSGPTAIAPVATSITAFVGRAPIGPTGDTTMVLNYGDFTRAYGGLKFDYPMSYAVQDFFDNGGSQAVIARLFQPGDEAGDGNGVAVLKFPPAPIELPNNWMLEVAAVPGATTLFIVPPAANAGDAPDIGLNLQVGGDPTVYLVTNFRPPVTGKNASPASITIVPALMGTYARCSALSFAYGPSPSGWTVQSQSQGTLTIQGGTGLPMLGQTFLGKDGNSYTATSQPIVTVTPFGSFQAKLQLTPTPPAMAFNFGDSANISDPVPLPMPIGWEIDKFTPGTPNSSGSVTLINGSGAPMIGDQFSIGADTADVYVVTGFTPVSSKVPEPILAFKSVSGQPLVATAFCHCCPPIFNRPPPQGMKIKTGPAIGATSFKVQAGPTATGVVDIGDTFTVNPDLTATVYSVRYVDPTSGTVYFLPEAETAFSGTNEIIFAPPLTLAAANPGQWGNYLSAQADTNGITTTTAMQFQEYGIGAEDLFNLTLTLTNSKGIVVATERWLNLSIKTGGDADRFPNRIDRFLAANSNLAIVPGQLPSSRPGDGAAAQGVGGNDGTNLTASTYIGDPSLKTGLYLLDHEPLFNLLCIPPDQRFLPGAPDVDIDPLVRQAAADYCATRRAFYIVDPPSSWASQAAQGQISQIDPETVGITGQNAAGIEVARNAAVYFPRIWKEDILMKSQLALFAPSGAIAGVMAATDVSRGVWKAPAGTGAGLANVQDLEVHLSDDENGLLNPQGINCLRNFANYGPVVWGARTLRGGDAFEDAYKYIPVRRLTLFIEDSLYRGTQWAVFEPNDEALWSSLRLTVGSFLAGLSRQGAFYNYAVKCDATTTTPTDQELGIVNILVQIAPVDPAEFVVIQIQQIAGAAPG